MPDWPELSTRFELDLPFGDDVRPTQADLDAFEARFGLRLPDDYRRFALAFGAGDLGVRTSCHFFAPGAALPNVDLIFHNSLSPVSGLRQTVRYMAAAGHIRRDPDWAGRLIFFCSADEGENNFAWQPLEVTDPATHDMAIYLCELDGSEPVRVAATFRRFVMNYLLGDTESGPADSWTYTFQQHP